MRTHQQKKKVKEMFSIQIFFGEIDEKKKLYFALSNSERFVFSDYAFQIPSLVLQNSIPRENFVKKTHIQMIFSFFSFVLRKQKTKTFILMLNINQEKNIWNSLFIFFFVAKSIEKLHNRKENCVISINISLLFAFFVFV